MKNKINIFCNDIIKNFLFILLSEYELKFMKLNVIRKNFKTSHPNIIIIENKKDADLIGHNISIDNCLIISNLTNINFNFINKSNLLSTPVSINHIQNKIENFLQNLKLQFHDISIHNERLVNIKNDNFCHLTKIELEILTYLIREKETSKNFVKENILNIKSNIETNSLESHLTRIRKKMNKVKTVVKIHSKSEKLSITA